LTYHDAARTRPTPDAANGDRRAAGGTAAQERTTAMTDKSPDLVQDYLIRVVFLCGRCQKFMVTTVDQMDWNGEPVTCGHCDREGTAVDARALPYDVCTTNSCKDFLDSAGTKHEKGKCMTCNKPLVALCDVFEELPDYPEPVEDDSVPRAVRQLKALTQQIDSWIASSGAHHKSTSGSHGSAATEQHSKAHASKAKLRDRWPDEVDALIKQVDARKWAAEVDRAKKAKAAVKNK
jgi:hypothetical protein